MIKSTIIDIAQKNFNATDAEADLRAWESNIASTTAFFQKRYDHLIPTLPL